MKTSPLTIREHDRDSLASTTDDTARISTFRELFQGLYKCSPGALARAGGRVNLIGEHVDYPDDQFAIDPPAHLYSMGGAVQNSFLCAASVREDRELHISHASVPESLIVPIEEINDLENTAVKEREAGTPGSDRTIPGWANHTLGGIALARRSCPDMPGLNILLTSNVPPGAGMSNSAANLVSLGLALDAVLPDIDLQDQTALVTFARDAENSRFAGGHCGWLDQMLIVHSRSGFLTSIDYADKGVSHFRSGLPDSMQFVCINTHVPHVLAESEYNDRVQELKLAFSVMAQILTRPVSSTSLTLTDLNHLITKLDNSAPKLTITDVIPESLCDSGIIKEQIKTAISRDEAEMIISYAGSIYTVPDLPRHQGLKHAASFALLLRRVRHQRISSLLVPLAGVVARSGNAEIFGTLLNSEGRSLRMSGDFQITGDNGAQDALLDAGFQAAKDTSIKVYGRMLGGGGGGNVLFYADRSDEENYNAWKEHTVTSYNKWASDVLKDSLIKATVIEPIISSGATLL